MSDSATRDPKSFQLSAGIHEYLVAHGTPPDPLLQQLADETAQKLGGISRMQVAPEQGAMLSLLVASLGVRSAVEVGTFTGYSSICIARGLPDDGHLLCCDVSEEWTSIARRYWDDAGVADRIELRIAPAVETLRAFRRDATIDFAFIDADKESYVDYYEELVPRLRANAVLMVDNVLWGGRVIDTAADDSATLGIRRFNDHAAADDRTDTVMLPVSDGITLIRKRS